ncbi:hypothetical protein [Marinobacter sp. CHS3-4]|uniref:hypothetical protein n=1 Tax=Marinobacter sp. CHS3-4 TaxID=3045174 RepID=UPI0024B534FF|nr:hypothetical protein [Marinobacter sp. CHS3-4]MDI9244050.1 hypothetical protein [Marinobacter sp. CHS3-4]
MKYSLFRVRNLSLFSIPAILTATLLSGFPASAFSQENQQRLDQLEARLNSLQKQVTESSLEKAKFNGFFSTGYVRATNDAGYDDSSEESDLQTLSLFGLQGTFALGRNTDAVLQLVSRGSEDWDTELEWGYVRHQFHTGTEVRAGKMRLPLFMESETLEIGFGQPWARPPEAVYDPIPVRSYLGADVSHTFNLDSSSIGTRLFAGHLDDEADSLGQTVDVELRNLIGLTTNWTNYLWTFRGVYARTEAFVGDPAGPVNLGQDEKAEFMGLGMSYDDGAWLLMSELTRVKVDGVFQNTDSAYITFGRRIVEVMPYVTASWIESKDNFKREGTALSVLDVRRQAYSLGFRWDLVPSVAMKFDWTHARGFSNTTGGLIGNQLGGNFESTDVYTVRLDAAF